MNIISSIHEVLSDVWEEYTIGSGVAVYKLFGHEGAGRQSVIYTIIDYNNTKEAQSVL
jgi:hypothetical protein